MNSAAVDLIYLDPPFNSKANYAAPIGSAAAGAEFKDTWTLSDVDVEWINLIEAKHPALYRVLLAVMTNSDKSYLTYMAARLIEMQRLLKPTGSIYLHCDPTMSHWLKLVMDAIFGRRNFRNEIVWCYAGGGIPKYDFPRKHDTILRYSVGDSYLFNRDMVRVPYDSDYKATVFAAADSRAPGKTYGPDERGKIVEDWWRDMPRPYGAERTGYPTQKPLALLHRIIDASSNEGDLVLDPFCGCATACIAAEHRGRQWVGIDIGPKAASLVKNRMYKELRMFYRGAHRTDIPERTDLGKLRRYGDTRNRKTLYGEQDGHCNGCREHFKSLHLEVDHIVPKAKGGSDHIGNLQLLCGHCNRVKGTRGMEYLKAKLQIAA